MKKFWSCLIVVFCSLYMCGCTKETNMEKHINFSEIFSYELQEAVIKINYLGFNEIVTTIEDPEKISSVLEILNNENYKIVKEEDCITGFYMFEFVLEDEAISFGLSGNYIAMGNQYVTESSIENSIFNALDLIAY